MNSPVTAAWLALRAPADIAARDASAAPLAGSLSAFLRGRCDGRPARLVDVGAGTGGGAAWLRPRLGVAQRWFLLDRDADLLAVAAPVAEGWAEPVAADLSELPALLAATSVDAVTCQALLDLLTADEIRGIVDAAAGARAALLAALTVTGGTVLEPAHPADALVEASFNAHQQRLGAPGPDAADYLCALLAAAGHRVSVVPTSWRLGPGLPALTREWLAGRAAAATEQSQSQAHTIAGWLGDRLADLEAGRLRAEVGHVDVLGLPPG